MAITAQYEIVPGVKVQVYIQLVRSFGGKGEGVGGVVRTFGGSTKPEAGAKPILPDYNSPHAEWSADNRNEIVVYQALKAQLEADAQYSEVTDC